MTSSDDPGILEVAANVAASSRALRVQTETTARDMCITEDQLGLQG